MAHAMPRPAPWRLALGLVLMALVGTMLHGAFAGEAPEGAPEVPSCVGCHSGAPNPPASNFSRFAP